MKREFEVCLLKLYLAAYIRGTWENKEVHLLKLSSACVGLIAPERYPGRRAIRNDLWWQLLHILSQITKHLVQGYMTFESICTTGFRPMYSLVLYGCKMKAGEENNLSIHSLIFSFFTCLQTSNNKYEA
jgi:hypothetical protein